MIAETALLSGSIWTLHPKTGALLGLDTAALAARLSVHPPDIARAAMALCLAVESSAMTALTPSSPQP